MKTKQDSPGVIIPPPVFYIVIFILALLIQKILPVDRSLFHYTITKGIGILFLALSLYFILTALEKFFKSNNTVILVKPANSLQTDGIYGITRNPMYCGMAFLYLGLTCWIGNWWNLILFPILLSGNQFYVIRSEEKYLVRAFGDEYLAYKKKVRRWL